MTAEQVVREMSNQESCSAVFLSERAWVRNETLEKPHHSTTVNTDLLKTLWWIMDGQSVHLPALKIHIPVADLQTRKKNVIRLCQITWYSATITHSWSQEAVHGKRWDELELSVVCFLFMKWFFTVNICSSIFVHGQNSLLYNRVELDMKQTPGPRDGEIQSAKKNEK